MARLRFRRSSWRVRVVARRVEPAGRFRRPEPLPPLPLEGWPVEVVDLGALGDPQAEPVDLGTIEFRPPGA